jgi:hypothetical protein
MEQQINKQNDDLNDEKSRVSSPPPPVDTSVDLISTEAASNQEHKEEEEEVTSKSEKLADALIEATASSHEISKREDGNEVVNMEQNAAFINSTILITQSQIIESNESKSLNQPEYSLLNKDLIESTSELVDDVKEINEQAFNTEERLNDLAQSCVDLANDLNVADVHESSLPEPEIQPEQQNELKVEEKEEIIQTRQIVSDYLASSCVDLGDDLKSIDHQSLPLENKSLEEFQQNKENNIINSLNEQESTTTESFKKQEEIKVEEQEQKFAASSLSQEVTEAVKEISYSLTNSCVDLGNNLEEEAFSMVTEKLDSIHEQKCENNNEPTALVEDSAHNTSIEIIETKQYTNNNDALNNKNSLVDEEEYEITNMNETENFTNLEKRTKNYYYYYYYYYYFYYFYFYCLYFF